MSFALPGDEIVEVQDEVNRHIKEYRAGVRVCPRTLNAMRAKCDYPRNGYDAEYIKEWDRQCFDLRKAMFCKRVAK